MQQCLLAWAAWTIRLHRLPIDGALRIELTNLYKERGKLSPFSIKIEAELCPPLSSLPSLLPSRLSIEFRAPLLSLPLSVLILSVRAATRPASSETEQLADRLRSELLSRIVKSWALSVALFSLSLFLFLFRSSACVGRVVDTPVRFLIFLGGSYWVLDFLGRSVADCRGVSFLGS